MLAQRERHRYLTDGQHLFRRATEVATAAGFTWLEDCRTLELLLVTADIVDSLRGVATADQRLQAGGPA
jgi:hypothetical protein